MITITEAAQKHFQKLLAQQANRCLQLRIEVIHPNSPHPECGIRFFEPKAEHIDDIALGFNGFILYVDAKSIPYLKDTYIDFIQDGLNGELFVETPHLKPQTELDATWPIDRQVQFMIDTAINPEIASHGGFVSLVEVTPDKIAILQFGGGCQGCQMVDVTLKQGVAKTLTDHIQSLKGVQDATDHSEGKNPYY